MMPGETPPSNVPFVIVVKYMYGEQVVATFESNGFVAIPRIGEKVHVVARDNSSATWSVIDVVYQIIEGSPVTVNVFVAETQGG